jgi:H+/Cl- antiporter ClcA
MTDSAPPEITAEQAAATMRSRQYLVLLILVSVIGVLVSLAAWCFLEGTYQLQQELFTHLPHALGYSNGPPKWWYFPVLGIGALIVALAITRLPGDGGHLPAKGLAPAGLTPIVNLPGILLAGFVTIGFALILGPEAPLIVLGSGVALVCIRAIRRDAEPPVLMIVAAAGAFAAVSFIFNSPLIAAVLIIEVAGIGGARLPLMLLPGLLAAGIGTLVSIGMGSFTGLSTSAYALGPLPVPQFGHPDIGQFGWTIALAIVIAVVTRVVMVGGLNVHRVVSRWALLLLPIVGLIVAGLAIAFHGATGKGINEVLFDGQSELPGLISQAGTWSLAALLWLIVFKGLAYGLALGSFRGGPTFPAMFLGAAGGIMASHLPGFALAPAVAVGIGATVASVLRLPLSAVVIATLLTVKAGTGDEALIIVGVLVAYLVTLIVSEATAEFEPPDRASAAVEARPIAEAPAPVPAG